MEKNNFYQKEKKTEKVLKNLAVTRQYMKNFKNNVANFSA